MHVGRRRDRALGAAPARGRCALPRPNLSVRQERDSALQRRTRSRSADAWCATTPACCSRAKAPSARSTASSSAAARASLDNHTEVDHAVPHCTSRELYKGVLGGAARGVFRGRVIVRPDAQKTSACAVEREPAARRARRDRHQAAARDLRRRREVQPRLDDRPARRGRALLPALARALRAARARPPVARVRARGARAPAGPRARRGARRRGRRVPARARSGGGRRELRRRRRPQGFSDPRAPSARQAARVPRQRGQRPEAARRDRRDRATSTPRTTPTCTAASTSSRSSATEHARGGARQGRRVPRRARPPRDRVHAQRHRGDQPGRLQLRPPPRAARATKCSSPHMEHHANFVPWQVLCEERGARAARGADRRPRRAAAGRVREAALAAHAARGA